MIKYCFTVILAFFLTNVYLAQVSNSNENNVVQDKTSPLFGLKKAGFEDIDPGQPIMLDGITIPVYTDSLKRVQGLDFMKIMMTNEYIPEPYLNDKKEIQAFVLRKATEQEKSQMRQMQTDIEQDSPLLGKEAIAFDVKNLKGKKYSLKSLKGKVIVINFWFIECKPCVMEMPELNKLVEKYKDKNVVFLGFATNEKKQIEKFLKKQKFNYQIIADSKEIVGSYKINAFPTHLIIDPNSIVRYHSVGLGPSTIEEIEKTIESFIH